MPRLAMEERHLAMADRDLAEGELRLTRQTALVEGLRRDGRTSPQAEALLVALRETLHTWREHRSQIVSAIERLKGGKGVVPADQGGR